MKIKFIRVASALVLVFTILTSCVFSQSENFLSSKVSNIQSTEVENGDDIVTFIVEIDGGGVLERIEKIGSRALTSVMRDNIASSVKSVQNNAAKSVIAATNSKINVKYTHVLNGFAIDGKRDMLDDLKAIDNVKNVYISKERYKLLSDEGSSSRTLPQDLFVGLDDNDLKYSGKGIVVGIIDSEIKYSHPVFSTTPVSPVYTTKESVLEKIDSLDLSGESMSGWNKNDVWKNPKIPYAFDYAGNDTDPSTTNTVGYHGTHVSGIAAGSCDEFSGIAKDAQIIFMKAGKDGSRSISDAAILAALDDLVKLDVDVINMSFGTDAGFTDIDSLEYGEIYDRLRTTGIAVSVSAGNSGRMGNDFSVGAPLASQPDYGLVSSPSTYDHYTSVASLTVPQPFLVKSFYLGEGNETSIEYRDASLSYMEKSFDQTLSEQTLDYVYCGYGTSAEVSDDLSGKIALIDRGGCSFADKVSNAQDKGAVGVIVVNNADDFIDMGGISASIPSVLITKTSGQTMKDAGNKKISVTQMEEFASSVLGEASMSDFSSWGVTPDLKLKPEITAAGGNILSAAYEGYEYLSGTSMSAPQYAGAIALMLEYLYEINPSLPKATAQEYAQRLLCSTAVPFAKNGVSASPRQQGAGVINVANAVDSPVMLYRSSDGKTKIELGDKLGTTTGISFNAFNISDTTETYTLSGEVLIDEVDSTSGKALVAGTKRLEGADIKFDSSTVTIEGNKEAVINATLDLSDVAIADLLKNFTNGFYVDGYIRLTPDNTDLPQLSIPFMGFYGDWTTAPIFSEGSVYQKSDDLYSANSGLLGKISGNDYMLGHKEENGNLTTFYSPNAYDRMVLHIDNKRNMANLKVSLKDSQGNLVSTIYNGGPFAKINTGDIVNALSFTGNLTDNVYIIELEATLDYIGATPQKKSFTVCFDTIFPILTDAYLESSNLYVKGSDLNGTVPALYDKTSGGTMEKSSTTENGYSVFNVTAANLANYEILLLDPAMNMSELPILNGNLYVGDFNGDVLKSITIEDAWVSDGILLNRPEVSGSQRYFVWNDNLTPMLKN